MKPVIVAPVSSRRAQRGFSLVELMVVVTIVGILASIGVALFRKHVTTSRAIEAVNMIQAIRGAQERWRAETQRYVRVSTELTTYYPVASPGQTLEPWLNPDHTNGARWQRLGVPTLGQVQCVYTTVAGGAGSSPDDEELGMFATPPSFGTQNQPWYLIHAKSDTDGDSKEGLYLAASFSGEVYAENEGE